eukprot:COSAG02_NODE_17240_length_1018_cov_3.043526_1_plen_184_part_00
MPVASAAPLRRFLTGHSPARATPQVYADSYTLSGCSDAQYCGVFHRVAAHCAVAGGSHCPGGDYARPGWSDATLCDGAPAYQLAGGDAVLYRYMLGDNRGSNQWSVADSSRLADCGGSTYMYRTYYYHSATLSGISGSNPQPSALPPDAAGYGWSEPGGYDDGDNGQGAVHIVAGDGSGGGGR